MTEASDTEASWASLHANDVVWRQVKSDARHVLFALKTSDARD